MKLKLIEIEPEGSELERTLDKEWLDAVISGAGSVDFRTNGAQSISIRAQRMGMDVFLQAGFHLDLTADCSACLQDFQLRVPVSLAITLKPKPRLKEPLPEELELTREDLEEFYFEGDFIDLTDILREQILLALPMYPRCREDCRGLCAVCGANLNLGECGCDRGEIDPRWAALKTLSK